MILRVCVNVRLCVGVGVDVCAFMLGPASSARPGVRYICLYVWTQTRSMVCLSSSTPTHTYINKSIENSCHSSLPSSLANYVADDESDPNGSSGDKGDDDVGFVVIVSVFGWLSVCLSVYLFV